MAITKRPFGKDSPERFIDGALTGGSGPSAGIRDIKVNSYHLCFTLID